MITIDRVTPKTTKTNKPYVLIEASGKTYSSFDLMWQSYIGRAVDERHVVRDAKGYLNLPDTKTCFGIPPDPRAAVPVVPQALAGNGIQAQQTAAERYEILSRQVAEILAILRAHFK